MINSLKNLLIIVSITLIVLLLPLHKGYAAKIMAIDSVLTCDLSDNPKTVEKKVMGMYTDPQRIRADIPGIVEGNPVFIYHDHFNENQNEVQDLKDRYIQGKVGDVEVKEKLTKAINNFLDPLRERRAYFSQQPGIVREILIDGAMRMEDESRGTLEQVREVMGMEKYQSKTLREEYLATQTNVMGGLAFM